MKKALFLLPALAVASTVQAETVQHQVSLSGTYASSEENSTYLDSDSRAYNLTLSGMHFLSPIETTGAVQNALIFLRRASYVSAGLSHYASESHSSFDFGGGNITSSEREHDSRSGFIAGQYFVNDNTFIGGFYTKTFESGADGLASIHGGYYYAETSAVAVSLSQRVGESDSTDFSISNKSVLALNETNSLAYNLGIETEIDDIEDSMAVEFGTTYYFTDYTGLGVSGDYYIDASEFNYSLSFNHFFNDTIGFNAWISEPDEGLDSYGASIIGRF